LLSLEKRRLQGDFIAGFQYLKRAYKTDGDKLSSKSCCDRTKGKGFKVKEGRFRCDVRKKFSFWHKCGETQVAQRGGRYPIPANLQGQAGQGSEQSDPIVDIPAHCSGFGLDGL